MAAGAFDDASNVVEAIAPAELNAETFKNCRRWHAGLFSLTRIKLLDLDAVIVRDSSQK
ncbi:MAG: hypothetical protein AB8G99_08930 [Planctomycetaceae bacterium]